jgi:hypothetical protein
MSFPKAIVIYIGPLSLVTFRTSDCDGPAHVLHDAVGYRETHSGTFVQFLLVVLMPVVYQKGPLFVSSSILSSVSIGQIQFLVCQESLRSCVRSF